MLKPWYNRLLYKNLITYGAVATLGKSVGFAGRGERSINCRSMYCAFFYGFHFRFVTLSTSSFALSLILAVCLLYGVPFTECVITYRWNISIIVTCSQICLQTA